MSDEALSKIIINGQEYDPEEAQQLVELGNKWRETERTLNTSLDKVVPEYTKATQERAALREQLEAKDAEIAKFQSQIKQAETPKEQADVIKAAREAGLADREWLNEQGYIKKSDLEDILKQRDTVRQQADEVMQKANELESKIDGSDGRVPFIKEAVLAYAYVNNMTNLEEAYEKMNERPNAKWKEAELTKAKAKAGLTTQKGSGSHEPEGRKKVDDSNARDLLREALWGTGEQ